jgi:hypothetical protein
MSEQLPPYNPDAKCPECGFADITKRFCGPDQRADDAGECCFTKKHLHRQCSGCGYKWHEACLSETER